MINSLKVTAVIPALNEEAAIGKVVEQLLNLSVLEQLEPQKLIDAVVVCDNGSTDSTGLVAENAGAHVVKQSIPGYGKACLTALAALPNNTDIVLFVDGDDSCKIEQAVSLLNGVANGDDLAIGSRTMGHMESGALTVPQQFGNWLAAKLIRFFWGVRITDLGPFRAIRADTLRKINMQDEAFGWTVEMQIKAIQYGCEMNEYPVDSKVRIGQSKISGTVKGTIGAAKGILGTIFKLRWRQNAMNTADIQE
ncbi:glycosyltransferase family 2 protein [Alteromonas sp. 5E99-2]|uniref:glycosyltransferase family 2 protein n=1 Tax=Alteromonas sp. 5E99-2 TaxID=2817683 RepID=UPI001A988458|nr:glycosyltransferase family 2 protein [Alteromonas sp. 5E99-2]MBO1256581.1 glycosyltransferase family 2 protein [Alteromonas sp. 5E99-2]